MVQPKVARVEDVNLHQVFKKPRKVDRRGSEDLKGCPQEAKSWPDHQLTNQKASVIDGRGRNQ